MSDSADDILNSLKGSLKTQLPMKDNQTKIHEQNPPTLTFKEGAEEHSFPYTQIRHMKRAKEMIVVSTFSANITVKGRKIEQLYSQLRRYKIAVIAKSEKEEEEQVFIESISVIYNSEEDNHD